MKTQKLSTLSVSVSSALRVSKFAAEAAELTELSAQTEKVANCHGAARTMATAKLMRKMAAASPEAAYGAIRTMDPVMWHQITVMAYLADRKVRDTGAKPVWKETMSGRLMMAVRKGASFRAREAAELVFLGDNAHGRWTKLAQWAEVDSLLESAMKKVGVWSDTHSEPALCVVRTEDDGLLRNDMDNVQTTVLSVHDNPEWTLEFLASAGFSPEKAYMALEEIARKGEITITVDRNVTGESGDISTAQGFADAADEWLAKQEGEVPSAVLWHRPADKAALDALLEDPEVFDQLYARGAQAWADDLPFLTKPYPTMAKAMFDEDGLPFKGRKAVRKFLTKLAVWVVQGEQEVTIKVANDTGSLTAGGMYRPGETSMAVSLAERAVIQYHWADSDQTVTSDFERAENAFKFWTQEIPRLQQYLLPTVLKSSAAMWSSLATAKGIDVPLDSVAFDQVAAAMVLLPKEIPAGIVVKPVTNIEGVQIMDDLGRPLSWVTPFEACWNQDGTMTENGRRWAKFVLDNRALARDIDAHEKGAAEALDILRAIM